MDETYLVELTGKQLILLCNCIDERINSNITIGNATRQKNHQSENRSLRSLQRYFRNIKHPENKTHCGTPP